MRGFKRCRSCGDKSFNVEPRQGGAWLCAECNVDARGGSTVRQVPVPEKVQQDRYAQLAARHGL